MKRALALLFALHAVALAVVVCCRLFSNGTANAKAQTPAKRASSLVSQRIPRAKQALITLFSLKEGEMPPELPQLTFEEQNLLPMVIENELTDADGCKAVEVRREFRLFMECGGSHADFLPAYRRKLLKHAKNDKTCRISQENSKE